MFVDYHMYSQDTSHFVTGVIKATVTALTDWFDAINFQDSMKVRLFCGLVTDKNVISVSALHGLVGGGHCKQDLMYVAR